MTSWEVWVQSPFAKAAGWAIFHSLWQGAAIAVAFGAILALVRPARARYAAGCLALGALAIAFAVTFFLFLPGQAVHSGGSNFALISPDRGTGSFSFPQPAGLGMARWLPWAAPFWLGGVILFYLRHLVSWAGARRLRRTGVCNAPEDWQERLRVLRGLVRVSRPVVLLESCLAGVPVVIGHLRPVILMPVGLLAGLPAAQIESILLHELAHIRRCDYLVNLMQALVEGLLFYHPAAWWLSGVIRREREHCCDDAAVALTGNAHEYARALTALEETRWGGTEAALAATGGNLVKRIRRLLVPAEGPRTALTPVAAAGLLLLTTAITLAAWQANRPAPEPASPYTKWVEEDVIYIITEAERAAFLGLATDQEREQFIKQFWERRDPTPGTPENEYLGEHYRRIAYTNDHFSAPRGTPGWKTDRGRIYILFGPPDEREEHPNGDAGTPSPYDVWRYRYIQGIGVDVLVKFVDVNRSGDYPMMRDPNGTPVTRPDR